MTSYFRSWLTTGATVPEAPPDDALISISPLEEDDEGSDTPTEGDDDSPPAFPSLSSAQRMRSSTRRAPTDSELMPPPQLQSRSSSSLTVLATTKPSPKKREKVALAPGHGPLDWANLKASGTDLRVRPLNTPLLSSSNDCFSCC